MSAPNVGDQTLGKGDLLRWSMRLAAKQPATLATALVATLLVVAVELIKPWPLKVLVDNGISGEPLSGTAGRIVEALPGTGSQDGLIAWCAAATVVVFAAGLGGDHARRGFGGGAQPAHDLRIGRRAV